MYSSYNPPTISSIYIEGLEISAKDAEAAAIAARDAAQAARDDALQYRNETHTYYTQVQQIQTGDYVTTQSLNDALSAFSFSDLASVPTSFTPSAHSHAWGDISGKPSAFTPAYHTHLWAHITDKPTEFEPAEHVHTWQQIAQKPGTFPPESHYHNWSEIEGKPSAFNPAAHTHSWGDISGKPTKFEPVVHTHDWSAIDNKPLAFPPQSHTHHWDTVTNKPAQATRWPTFTEVTDKPVQATRWPKYSEVTEKPTLGSAAERDVGKGFGELLEVGAFGLGTSTPPNVSDINGIGLETQFFSFPYGAVGSPDGEGGAGLVISRGGVAYSSMLVITTSGGVFNRFYNEDGWGEWFEGYTSGNSVNPLKLGIGGNGAFINGNNANNAIEGGIYNATSSTVNTAISGTSAILVSRSFNVVSQINVDGNNMFIRRSTDTGATYQPWREIVHSGNYNGDTFGGLAAGDVIAKGVAVSNTLAKFMLPISMVNQARTLEVNGTFAIHDEESEGVVVSGVNGFSINSRSSSKMAVVYFNAAASLFVQGKRLELRLGSNDAYLKVGE